MNIGNIVKRLKNEMELSENQKIFIDVSVPYLNTFGIHMEGKNFSKEECDEIVAEAVAMVVALSHVIA